MSCHSSTNNSQNKDQFILPKNFKKKLIQKTKINDRDAQFRVGLHYQIIEHYGKAVYYYKQAVFNGDYVAACNLGVLVANGLGTICNFNEAFKYLLWSASNDYSPAQVNIAILLIRISQDTESQANSFRWMLTAANNGNVSAQRVLGLYYSKGIGCNINHERAAFWVLKGAMGGDVSAMYTLGVFLLFGIGTMQNSKTALEWLHKAAFKNHLASCNMLGIIYYVGDNRQAEVMRISPTLPARFDEITGKDLVQPLYHGIKKDLKQSKKWFKIGARNGNEDCRKNLQELIQHNP